MDAKEIYLSKPWLKHYPNGVPADAEIPERSIPEIFEEVRGKYARKPALIFYGRKITYANWGNWWIDLPLR